VLIIDRSASMAIDTPGEGVSKMAMAKEAAILAARHAQSQKTAWGSAGVRQEVGLDRPTGVIEEIGLQNIEQRTRNCKPKAARIFIRHCAKVKTCSAPRPAISKHIRPDLGWRGTEVKYDDLMARMPAG